MESSQARDCTLTLCIGRWILIHCTTREVLIVVLVYSFVMTIGIEYIFIYLLGIFLHFLCLLKSFLFFYCSVLFLFTCSKSLYIMDSGLLLLTYVYCRSSCSLWLVFDSLNSESESEVAQSCLTLCNPCTVAHQAPPSMGFSSQEYWSGLPFPSPEDLPNPGIEPRSPTLWTDALTSEPPGKPWIVSFGNKRVFVCFVFVFRFG